MTPRPPARPEKHDPENRDRGSMGKTVTPLPDLDSLRCFVQAVTFASFRTAARKVALSPAAFGARIRRLDSATSITDFLEWFGADSELGRLSATRLRDSQPEVKSSNHATRAIRSHSNQPEHVEFYRPRAGRSERSLGQTLRQTALPPRQ
jgi:hypothetical protein